MNDEVIAFKSLCKSYKANKKALKKINDRIEDSYYLISGLSRRTDGERVQGSSDPALREARRLEAYDKIARLKQRAGQLEANINMVNDCLSLMNATAREAITAIYITRQCTEQAQADKIYMSISTLKRHINRSIAIALDRYNEL